MRVQGDRTPFLQLSNRLCPVWSDWDLIETKSTTTNTSHYLLTLAMFGYHTTQLTDVTAYSFQISQRTFRLLSPLSDLKAMTGDRAISITFHTVFLLHFNCKDGEGKGLLVYTWACIWSIGSQPLICIMNYMVCLYKSFIYWIFDFQISPLETIKLPRESKADILT